MRWIREMFEHVRRDMGIPSSRWIYGTTPQGLRARKHRLTGRVEFVLWKAGEQGHTEDYWAPLGDGHVFTPETDRQGHE